MFQWEQRFVELERIALFDTGFEKRVVDEGR
jgi:hypothetical protein